MAKSASKLDGKLLRDYVRDVEARTGRKFDKSQIENLKEALRNNEYERMIPKEVAKHRAEFNRKKNSMISDWEKQTGQQWPTYTEEVIGKNGDAVRKIGDRYDAHHIIENSFGGNNEWWNIHPAKFPNEHQAGIHKAGSPARELFK
ncbi:HNH endonuclease signature motif containing protein [Enterococcus sp. AZ126]|uniref:HNH endonuclease signature motif containing protein n=1 Tax=Enterococcus sp. AZ126 TaxID=2774635 RepID=UPI003F23E2AE